MIKRPPLALAMEMASLLHQGQVDKAGDPYLMHLVRVAGKCQTEEEMIVAFLHDTVEDTDATLGFLGALFEPEIVAAVDYLTRRNNETYPEFIRRTQKNLLASRVKLIDVIDHLRREEVGHIENSLRTRYRMAYREMTGLNWDNVKHLPD